MDSLRRSILLALAIGLVLCGGGTMIWLIESKPLPETRVERSRVPTVAILLVEPRTAQIPVVAYGTVRPKNQVQIVPQISGELIFTHPNLAQGKIIVKGDLLFELEPTVFEARVQQAEAEVRGLEAALGGHNQEVLNIEARIAIAEKMSVVDERDYLTSKRLLEEEGVGTQRSLDAVYQKYLRQQDIMVSLKSHRATAPYLKRETQAKLDAARARLAQVRYDLENTKILCPFTARVESVGAYRSQMVTAHLSIATLTDMEAFEIAVSVDPRELRWLDRTIRPHSLEGNTSPKEPEVEITWSVSGRDIRWRGSVTRFERIDDATRTARMVVEVRNIFTLQIDQDQKAQDMQDLKPL